MLGVLVAIFWITSQIHKLFQSATTQNTHSIITSIQREKASGFPPQKNAQRRYSARQTG